MDVGFWPGRRLGRALAVDSDCVPGKRPGTERRANPEINVAVAAAGFTGETLRLVQTRAQELVAYQDSRLALSYVAEVGAVWKAERELGPRTTLSAAAARHLYELMAYNALPLAVADLSPGQRPWCVRARLPRRKTGLGAARAPARAPSLP